MSRPALSALALGAVLVGALTAACAPNTPASTTSGPITVTSTADECRLSAAEAPAGTLTFSVKNEGDEVTEFYLLAEDGQRVVSELEDIGPGLVRDLVVQAEPGTYVAACKPGMAGDGIRHPFSVTDAGASTLAP